MLSGVVLSLAFPEPDLSPLAWVALVPLLLTTSDTRPRLALGRGLAYGVGFFGTLLAWISLVGWLAWALLVALQACFIGAFAGIWSLVARRLGPVERIIAAAALWVSLDALRATVPVGGFTWGELAQSQHDMTWLLRLASLGGGWLVTFVVVVANASLAEMVTALRAPRPGAAAGYLLAAAIVIIAPALLAAPVADGRALRVAIVQGNVPRSFTGALFEKELGIVRRHSLLTRRLRDRGIDLVVWPESAVGLDLERVPAAREAVSSAARAVDAPMIVGGNLDEGTSHYLVMAFEISAAGNVVDRYQKTHLVPFGEYVPARDLLGWLPPLAQVPRDALAGSEPVVFSVAGGKVAPVISFEGDFGPLVRRRIDAGGRLLVVATNTSTWSTTWASAQHLAFSQVRAAENGVWVVHAALSGISGFVRPDGHVTTQTPLWRATTAVRDVRFASGTTLYTRAGEWLPVLCVALSLLALARGALGRRRVVRLR